MRMETARRRRSLISPSTYVVVGVVVLVAALATAGVVLYQHSRLVTVPAVTGLPLDVARQSLGLADLELVVSGERLSVDVPAGSIISQDPEAGSTAVSVPGSGV